MLPEDDSQMLEFVRKYARRLVNSRFTAPRRNVRSLNRRELRGLSPQFETLEQRRLLSANQISLDSKTASVVVKGSSTNDTAIISVASGGAIQVQLQTAGGTYTSVFPGTAVSAVKFYGGNGNDTFKNISHLPSEAYGDNGADELHGGSNTDKLFGGAGNDVLNGGDGDDVVDGGAGNDSLSGWDGNDNILGGINDDYLAGGPGNDKLFGGTGHDGLSGDEGDDELRGNEGNDWLGGWTGNDTLLGDAGNDHLVGAYGDDSLDGGDNDDQLHGEDGNDRLTGGAGNDSLFGGLGDDELRGAAGNDQLSGELGNDRLYGDQGNDSLSGWIGNDDLFGGAGNDQLVGNDGDDNLTGEDGDDALYGDGGNDWLWGGTGNDTLNSFHGGNDFLIGGMGNDTLVGTDGNELLDGGPGKDLLNSGLGNDVLIGGLGQDNLRGEAGSDLLLGGTTIYQDSQSYAALLNTWSSSASYAARIQQMESDLFAARLQSEETVLDDGIADEVFGGEGNDWFFVTGAMSVYRPGNVEPLVHDEHAGHAVPHHITPPIVTLLPALEGFELIDALDHLQYRQPEESIHTLMPHVDNPTLQREHLSLFQLVRYDQATHIAVRSGNWSDPATWGKGVPTNRSRVLIPLGVEVKVDRVLAARFATIRVDGTLSFDPSRNTELRVDTVVVSSHGTFQMGTAAQPIAPGVKARLSIANTGAIDRKWDPFGISRGLISHGKVSIHGAEVSAYEALAGPVFAGTATLQLKSVPVGWKAGDAIVIAGAKPGSEQNELRQILSVAGNTVQLNQPLAFTHAALAADLEVHVSNLTRNAVVESESPIIARRGHVMFMHSRDVDVAYAGFYKLGRTEKQTIVNDAVVNPAWILQAGTGTNPRGRYAVHFHRNGLTNDGHPAVIKGSAVVDSPGWGFVNHSSYVDMVENVAYGVRGAAFVTEVGDEIGGFYRNLAVGTTGINAEENQREPSQDFGFNGDGFWFQGAGIAVVGNISAGNQGHAYIFYTRGLVENGVRREFPSVNLPNPAIAQGATSIPIGQVPMVNFNGNLGYASRKGLVVRYHLESSTHGQKSAFENSTLWNNGWGVALPYGQNIVLRNIKVVADPSLGAYMGIGSFNNVEGNTTYDNVTVTGYARGILVPRWGTNIINGGTFNNQIDIEIQTGAVRERLLQLNGLPVGTRINMLVYLYPLPNTSISNFWVPDTVLLNFGPFVNRRLYSVMQRAQAVPFPEPRPDIPPEYIGLTNQQLWDRYQVAIGGAIAPSNAITVPNIDGLISPVP
jgi:Ca2+-binding RTX toxin-like protein